MSAKTNWKALYEAEYTKSKDLGDHIHMVHEKLIMPYLKQISDLQSQVRLQQLRIEKLIDRL